MKGAQFNSKCLLAMLYIMHCSVLHQYRCYLFFLKFMGAKTKIPVDQKRNTNMYKAQISTIGTTRLKVISFKG